VWLWVGDKASVIERVGSSSFLVFRIDEPLVEGGSQCFDSGGPKDGLEVVVDRFHLRDRVDGLSIAHLMGQLLPLFPVSNPVDFFFVEHAVACTKARDDRVGTGDADSGKVVVGRVQDGVDVTTVVGEVLVVSADVAVARCDIEFLVWWCNCGVDNDSLVDGVLVAFGTCSVP
jgi:hypothetical protein